MLIVLSGRVICSPVLSFFTRTTSEPFLLYDFEDQIVDFLNFVLVFAGSVRDA